MIERRNAENRLREYIKDNIIHPKELKEKARAAKNEAWRVANEKSNDPSSEGMVRPNDKGVEALENLRSEIKDNVIAHGLASNLPTQDPDFPINALIAVLATGNLKGDTLKLLGGGNAVVFKYAPFVLLSNKAEPLAEDDGQGNFKLKGLRTVLVNGEYEAIVEDLRKAFPHVSFRTADQINDSVFERREPQYRSYEDQIREQLKKQKR